MTAGRVEQAAFLKKSQEEGNTQRRISEGINLKRALEDATARAPGKGTCTACVVRFWLHLRLVPRISSCSIILASVPLDVELCPRKDNDRTMPSYCLSSLGVPYLCSFVLTVYDSNEARKDLTRGAASFGFVSVLFAGNI